MRCIAQQAIGSVGQLAKFITHRTTANSQLTLKESEPLRNSRKRNARIGRPKHVSAENALNIVCCVPVSNDSLAIHSECDLAISGERIVVDVELVRTVLPNGDGPAHLLFESADGLAYPGMTGRQQPRQSDHNQKTF